MKIGLDLSLHVKLGWRISQYTYDVRR